jgi:hypothetical protein
MRKLPLLLLVIINQFCFSQNWEHTIGITNRNEVFRSLSEAYDGGYLVLGAYHFFPDTRGWIIKTDINGNVLYDLTIGMPGSGLGNLNYPSYISPTSDGGFIICGSHDRWTVNDIGITKHNACGDLEWCKVFRTDNSPDWGVEIQQLQDGGYIMLTMGYNANSNNPRVHLFRLNSEGDLLWIEPYALTANHPYLSYNDPYDLVITPDEDFFISGLCYWCDDSVATGGINNRCRLKAMAILADSSRQEEWVSVYKATDTLAYSIAGWATQHESGSFFVGAVDQSIWPSSLPRLLKYDISGNLLADSLVDIPMIDNKWAEGFMVNPSFTNDGKLFACIRFADENTSYPGWFGLHELDSLGGWHNSIIHPTAHAPVGLIVTSDNKLLAGAVVGSELDQDIILMKFNTSLEYDSIYTAPRVYDYLCPDPIVSKTIDLSDCDVIVNVEDIPTRKEYEARINLITITPAPNPAKEYVRFLLKNTEYHKNIRVICYDIFGRQLAELPVNSGVNETGLSISGWRPGLYMAVVYSGNRQMGKARYAVE